LDVPAVEALLVIGWALFLGTVIWVSGSSPGHGV
jgi:hypothetical protein